MLRNIPAGLPLIIVLFCCFAACSSCYGMAEDTERNGEYRRSLHSDDVILDRYWNNLLDNPQFGAVFDRVYYHYTENIDIPKLIQKLEEMQKTDSAEKKGKSLFLLGLVYIRQNELARSVSVLQEANRILPNDVSLSIQLGKTLVLQGCLQEGVNVLEKIPQSDLSSKEKLTILELIGKTWLRLNKPEKTMNAWKDVIEDSSIRPDELFRLGGIYERAGRFRDALNVYEKAKIRAHECKNIVAEVECMFSLVDMKIRLGEKKDALKDCERLLEEISEENWLYSQLRDRMESIFLQESDYTALLDYYGRRIENHPNDLDCIRRQALLLNGLSRMEEARNVLNNGLKKAPSSIVLLKTLAEIEIVQNNYAEAERLYEKLDTLEPRHPDTLLAWGNCALHNAAYDEQTRKDKAVKIWKKLLDSQSEDRSTIILVIDTLCENGLQSECEPLLQRLVSLFPEDVSSYERLATWYLNENNEKDAFRVLDQMTSGTPKVPDSFISKAKYLRTHGYCQEAILAVKDALKLDGNSFESNRLLLDILLENGEYAGLDAEFDQVELLAQNDNEKNILFLLRLRYLREINGTENYLDSLDKKLNDFSGRDLDFAAELYWKKTTLLLFLNDSGSAVETVITALNKNAISPILLQKAAETADKSPLPEKSLELLRLLCKMNSKESGGYLKTIANIQLELGLFSDAVSTGKRILNDCPKSSVNYRNSADIFIRCGQIEKAVEILRQAIRLDTRDMSTLTMLAELLDNTGKTREAIDVLRQVFNSSSRLEEKLQITEILAKYYAKIDEFELLKDILTSHGKDIVSRRENTYCLARAYSSVQDYTSARAALETLLSFIRSVNQDEELLLSHLSQLAEMQNDLQGAVQYQEKLCGRRDNPAENERLLGLYNRIGDKNKGRQFLLNKIVPKESFGKQLETIDALLAVEEYDSALEIIQSLEKKYPDHWEIQARHMMIAGWKDCPELSTIIAKLRNCPLPPDSRSINLPKDKSGAVAASISPAASWHIGTVVDHNVNHFNSPEYFDAFTDRLILTIYREHLALNDSYSRSGMTSLEKHRKPILSFPTLLTAQMAAEAWSLKKGNTADPIFLHCITNDIEAEIKEDFSSVYKTRNDSDLLKTYIYSSYMKKLVENNFLQEKDNRVDCIKVHCDRCRYVAVLLGCSGKKEWHRKSFSTVLDWFIAEKNQKNQAAQALILLRILDKSIVDSTIQDDIEIWERANEIAAVLENKGFSEKLKQVQSLITVAGKRDYTVFLNTSREGTNVSLDAFAASIRSARNEAIKQVRSQSERDKAYSFFGDVFAARLNTEYQEAFKRCDPAIKESLETSSQVWQTLSEKMVYGPRAVETCIRLNRNSLIPALSDKSMVFFENPGKKFMFLESVQSYMKSARRVLTLAMETEKAMNIEFSKRIIGKNRQYSGISFAELYRYISKDRNQYMNLASFLINRAVYGKKDNDTIAESSALLERIYGICFKAEMCLALSTDAMKQKKSSDAFTDIIDKQVSEDEQKSGITDGSVSLQKVREIHSLIKNMCSGEYHSENISELKEAADKVLQQNKKDAGENADLYAGKILLALLERRDEDAVTILDKLPCRRFSDLKMRELCILNVLAENTNVKLAVRKDAAMNRLSGYRLDEDESMIMRTLLTRSGQNEKAEKVYARLLQTTQKTQNRNILFDEIIDRHKKNGAYTEDEIVFALKTFRSPIWNYGTVKTGDDLRNKALNVLASAGKLDEVRTQLERQISAAPGSFDLLMQLAEVYLTQKRKQPFDDIVDLIEKHLPNDSRQMINFAKILARANRIDQAKALLKKTFLMNTELYLSERKNFSCWDSFCDMDLLMTVDRKLLVFNAYKVFSVLFETAKNEALREKAYALMDKLWQGETLDANSRHVIRSSAIRLLCQSGEERNFSMVKPWFLEMIRYRNPAETPMEEYQDIHRLIQWNNKQPMTLSWSFLNMTNNRKDLETLLDEVRRINMYYQIHPQAAPDRASASGVLEIQILLKLACYDQAVQCLREMSKSEFFCAKGFKSDPLALVSSFGKKTTQYADDLLPYFEKAYEENSHPVYEPYYICNICQLRLLGIDQKTKSEAKLYALNKLQEIFRVAAAGDVEKNNRVSHSLYSIQTLDLYLNTLGNSLLMAGGKNNVRSTMDNTNLSKRLFGFAGNDKMTSEWDHFIRSAKSIYNSQPTDVIQVSKENK